MECLVDTHPSPGIGVHQQAQLPPELILHVPSGRRVDPVTGTVYGVNGTPVGAVCADGYVRLGQNCKGHLYAHRLIYEVVHGPIPAGLYIDHKNGCKADNRIENLEAVTPSENLLRALERGARRLGELASNSKLTNELVRQLRATVGTVASREWARRLGVDPATIRAARKGATWRHVPMRGRIPRKPVWRRPR